MAHVQLPRSLVELFPGAPRRLDIDDALDVAQLIDRLDARWPGLADRLCDAGPELREYINVFVDGEPAGLSTPVGPGTMVHVLPAVAGG
ncbi:MAG: MoaD/ThiS family protein [Candidatus Limnocylindrales bacterium]